MPTEPEDALKLEYEVIGCELHDGPCQYITSRKCCSKRYAIRGQHLHMTTAVVSTWPLDFSERAGVELRRLIRGLHPLQLHDTRVLAIVERLSDENKMDGGPEIEWCLEAEFDELSNDLRVAILRILQECLTNVRRHSRTSKVLAGITQDDRSVCIQVQDWGIGFDVEKTRPECLGLNGIRQRARLLNGTMTIESSPGEGTCITVDLPLRMQTNPQQQQT